MGSPVSVTALRSAAANADSDVSRSYKVTGRYQLSRARGKTVGFATGIRVDQALRESGLTRDGFAEVLGVTGPFVSMLTAGRRELSLDVARRISAEWGYRVGWLLEGELPVKPAGGIATPASNSPVELLHSVMAQLRVLETMVAGRGTGQPKAATKRATKRGKVSLQQVNDTIEEYLGANQVSGSDEARSPEPDAATIARFRQLLKALGRGDPGSPLPSTPKGSGQRGGQRSAGGA